MTVALLPYSSLPAERIGVHPPTKLPAAIRLGTVHLAVANLVRSLDFYQRVLGFVLLSQTSPTEGQAAVAELGMAGSPQVLVRLQEQPGANPIPRRGRLGIYHLAVLLPTRADLGCFIKHMHSLGGPPGLLRPQLQRSHLPDRPRRLYH